MTLYTQPGDGNLLESRDQEEVVAMEKRVSENSWAPYKSEIIKLYQTMSLREVYAEMQEREFFRSYV